MASLGSEVDEISEKRILREGAKRNFLQWTQFLVVAASRSHYLLKTVPSLGCYKQPEG